MRCLIITPYQEGLLTDCLPREPVDFVLCADAAERLALAAGIKPNLVIGDFDHGDASPVADSHIVRVPSEKDDTDTMLCIKHAIAGGADELIITGGIGGRLDHTVANLQSLAYAHAQGVRAVLTDGRNEAQILSGTAYFPRRAGWYLSVFAFGGICRGVSERGVKYPLDHVELTPEFPLGVSNEITAEEAEIEVCCGRLLVIFSKKE